MLVHGKILFSGKENYLKINVYYFLQSWEWSNQVNFVKTCPFAFLNSAIFREGQVAIFNSAIHNFLLWLIPILKLHIFSFRKQFLPLWYFEICWFLSEKWTIKASCEGKCFWSKFWLHQFSCFWTSLAVHFMQSITS